jgi:hypothetical protein
MLRPDPWRSSGKQLGPAAEWLWLSRVYYLAQRVREIWRCHSIDRYQKRKGTPAMATQRNTKSQQSTSGLGRKLASGAGRNPKTGGEAQKRRVVPRGTGGRTGSSKQRKG